MKVQLIDGQIVQTDAVARVAFQMKMAANGNNEQDILLLEDLRSKKCIDAYKRQDCDKHKQQMLEDELVLSR